MGPVIRPTGQGDERKRQSQTTCARPHAYPVSRRSWARPAAAANAAGVVPEHFGRWLKDEAEFAISATPGLARIREIMHPRLKNFDDKWEANDLNDCLHLSYAGLHIATSS